MTNTASPIDNRSIFETRITDAHLQPAADQEVQLDLRRDCPICGQRYRSDDKVLALACFPFAVDAASSVAGCNSDKKVLLGHHACILPRLLTLLAGFQPEERFVKAANEPPVLGAHHEEP